MILPTVNQPASGWQGQVGVPGGIPSYTMYVNILTGALGAGGSYVGTLAVGDGVTDDAPAINAALTSCPDGQYVYLPAGTYRINNAVGRHGAYASDWVQHSFSIALKGDGPSQTRLISYASNDGLYFEFGGDIDGGSASITSGNTRGSTSIVVPSLTAPLSYWNAGLPGNGRWMAVLKPNSTSGWVQNPTGANNYQGNSCTQLVKITSITGTGPYTINFTPALNADGGVGDVIGMAASVPYRCGFEGLFIEHETYTGAYNNIVLRGGQECWVKNCESSKSNYWHVRLEECASCEVRECYVHHGYDAGGGSNYGYGLFKWSCNNLIENNIAAYTRHAMILEYGGQGNVFGYNYSTKPINNDKGPGWDNQLLTDYLMGDISGHGGNPKFNLWEGNVAGTIRWDSVLGANIYNTAFRNRIQRKSVPNCTSACFCSDIQYWNTGNSTIANVYELAPSAFADTTRRWGTYGDLVARTVTAISNTNPIVVTFAENDFAGGVFDLGNDNGPVGVTITGAQGNTAANVTNHFINWTSAGHFQILGVAGNGTYTGGASLVSGIDTTAQGTTIVHGDYDVGTNVVTWDGTISDRSPPNSYYLSGKPSWWDITSWPEIGPEFVAKLPGKRGKPVWVYGANPAYRRALANGY